MKNSLIPTSGVWYKIKRFFKNLFSKKSVQNKEIKVEHIINEDEKNFKNKFEEDRQKVELAQKLRIYEVSPIELTDDEVDEMIEYFKNDIQNVDKELFEIKQRIINIQKQIAM